MLLSWRAFFKSIPFTLFSKMTAMMVATMLVIG